MDWMAAIRLLLAVMLLRGLPWRSQAAVPAVYQPLPGLEPDQLAVVVNDADPLSRRIGAYYRKRRKIPPANVIHVRFPPDRKVLSPSRFKEIYARVLAQTPGRVQAYALAWTLPFRVGCMSITTAFASGYNDDFCATGCKPTRSSPYFNSLIARPFDVLGWRPAMLLAGKSLESVKRLIDRGIRADHSNPRGTAYLLRTHDKARSSRAVLFPAIARHFEGLWPVSSLEQDAIRNRRDVMFYFTGLTHVPDIATNTYLPGAIADHLTSTGGVLSGSRQMSILEWLEAGVTGSYGAVTEPCNFPQKFPHPGIVMEYYLRGNTLIEAYWKSVAWPGQGVFVGEPLARPFSYAR